VRVEVVSIEGGKHAEIDWRTAGQRSHIVATRAPATVVSVGPTVGPSRWASASSGSPFTARTRNCASRIRSPPGRSPTARDRTGRLRAVAYGRPRRALRIRPSRRRGDRPHSRRRGGVGLAAIQMGQTGRRPSDRDGLERRTARAPSPISVSTTASTTGEGLRRRSPLGSRITKVPTSSLIGGGENLQKSLSALAYRGRCVTFGNAGRGEVRKLDTSTLAVRIRASLLFPRARAVRGLTGSHHESPSDDDVARGDLRVVIDQRFALAEAEEAPRVY